MKYRIIGTEVRFDTVAERQRVEDALDTPDWKRCAGTGTALCCEDTDTVQAVAAKARQLNYVEEA